MNLVEKIERSRSSEKIDFTKISCLNQSEPLVKIQSSPKLIVEPIWTTDDLEGRLYATYIASHPAYDGVYLRASVTLRLEQAANSLPEPYMLVIRAGHRPIEVQKQVLHEVLQDYLAAHPHRRHAEALEHARMYVSDPDIKLPPHVCGAAVDVDMYDPIQQRYVDFGSVMNEDSDISHLHSPKITSQQTEYRLMLLQAMLNAGFASYYAEWWHYSYGDEIWAWFYRHSACLYSLSSA